ncbi:MAG: ectoine synthase [Cyanobacteria bacterium P01_F01_bin.150]
MFVRKLNSILGTERDVAWGNGQSRRFLIESDGMHYSLTDTTINEGSESQLEYKKHKETCYCISGEGEIEFEGIIHKLEPGSMYVLDNHEKHYLRAITTMRLICVFTPALQGMESHDLSSGKPSSY